MQRVWPVLLLAASGLACGRPAFEAARARQQAIDTWHDFELARSASASELATLEGLHLEDPGNEELMLELVRAWVVESERFILDQLESARSRNANAEANYQRERAAAAFLRAAYWAEEWLKAAAPTVDLRAPPSELDAALAREFSGPSDARALLWIGHALLGAGLYASDAAHATKATKPILSRALALDESAYYASPHLLLARYHGQSQTRNLEASRKHFARAEALAQGRYLPAQLYRALVLDCATGDRAAFDTALDEVLKASDPAPEVRLDNASAKQRAQRWAVSPALWQECKFSGRDE